VKVSHVDRRKVNLLKKSSGFVLKMICFYSFKQNKALLKKLDVDSFDAARKKLL